MKKIYFVDIEYAQHARMTVEANSPEQAQKYASLLVDFGRGSYRLEPVIGDIQASAQEVAPQQIDATDRAQIAVNREAIEELIEDDE
jgi:hypothetical protein